MWSSLCVTCLILADRIAILFDFVTLGAVVFHRFEVQQGIDGSGVHGIVEFVHLFFELSAPFGDEDREEEVDQHRGKDDNTEPEVERDFPR